MRSIFTSMSWPRWRSLPSNSTMRLQRVRPGVTRGIFFARPFHENLHLPADKVVVFARGDFVHQFQQAMIAFLADFLRHLVGHLGGGRVAALASI